MDNTKVSLDVNIHAASSLAILPPNIALYSPDSISQYPNWKTYSASVLDAIQSRAGKPRPYGLCDFKLYLTDLKTAIKIILT